MIVPGSLRARVDKCYIAVASGEGFAEMSFRDRMLT